MTGGRLLAISDVHVAYAENRRIVSDLRPESADDWLIVAGDVAERFADIERALTLLSQRFGTVVWVPGNHELWTPTDDPVQLRGEERYLALVQMCRSIGVHTPEDPYPVWSGAGGPVTVAPLHLLYDYSFRLPGQSTREEALAGAYEAGVVCNDEVLLHPEPYPSIDAWCHARITYTEGRLAERIRAADRTGEPLPADPGADADPALPRVRAVVRHGAHRGLAYPVHRRRRGVRASAHPAHHLVGRGALRRGVAGLPPRMGQPTGGTAGAADSAASVRVRSPGQSGSGGWPR